MKALRTPLNEVNSRVELDAGRVCLQLAGLGERPYSFEVFLEEIGGRAVKGPGQFAERDSVQVRAAPLLSGLLCSLPYTRGLCELQESRPAI